MKHSLKLSWMILTWTMSATLPVHAAEETATPPIAATASAAAEKITAAKKAFMPDAKGNVCLPINKVQEAKLDVPGLREFLAAIEKDLRDGRITALQARFHPRIAKKGTADRIINAMNYRYKRPWDVTTYKLWALGTPEGDRAIIDCTDDNVALTTRHSYPLQFAAWIDVMGTNELGRVYVSIVPSGNEWFIGGWMNQQWTQGGKDYSAWYDQSQKWLKMGKKREAYMALDVATKLLHGEEFMEFSERARIVAARDDVLDVKTWPAELNKLLKADNVVYAGEMFAQDGIGLLVRERVDEKLSTDELRKRCFAHGKTLMKEKWINADTAGLYCSFLYKNEPIDKEGALGGMYFTQKEITEAKL